MMSNDNNNERPKISRAYRCRYCGIPIVFNFAVLAASGNPKALELDGKTVHRCKFSSKSEEEYIMSAYEYIDEINRRIESYKLRLEKLEKSVMGATK